MNRSFADVVGVAPAKPFPPLARSDSMGLEWFITVGGLSAGVGVLLVKDHFKKRGLPVVPLWLLKTVGIGTLCVMVIMLILPLFGRRGEAKCGPSSVASNLNQIGKALLMYSDVPSSGGVFPAGGASSTESLWKLYPNYVADYRVFFNPSVGAASSPRSAGIVPVAAFSNSGISYVEGYGPNDAQAIIAFERFLRAEKRYVLFGSGEVKLMPNDEFCSQLMKQYFEKRKTEAKTSSGN